MTLNMYPECLGDSSSSRIACADGHEAAKVGVGRHQFPVEHDVAEDLTAIDGLLQ